MRVISIIVAIIVAISLYFLFVDRNSLINFLSKFQNEEEIETNLEINNKISEKQSDKSELPFVIVKNSIAEKTENILVDAHDVCKIADFGLTVVAGGGTRNSKKKQKGSSKRFSNLDKNSQEFETISSFKKSQKKFFPWVAIEREWHW